jgi:hypothetical protein
MLPVRMNVNLSGGSVTLTAWGAEVLDSRLRDLALLTEAFTPEMRSAWGQFKAGDIEAHLWPAFWRLANSALPKGETWPARLSWTDRLTVLNALWELNDLEEAEVKLKALAVRQAALMKRLAQKSRSMNS